MTTDINFINNKLKARFDEFETNLNGFKDDILHPIRKKGFEAFEKQGLPTTKHEEYKYTHLGKVLEKKFDRITPSHIVEDFREIDLESIEIPNLDAYRFVMVNGVYSKKLSDNELDVFTFSELQKLPIEYAELLKKHFSQHHTYREDAFTALNTAFMKNGTFIKIDTNTQVEKPIVIYNISDASRSEWVSYPRNLVIVEQGSEVELIEVFGTLGKHNSLVNTTTEIIVKDNAKVNYYKIGNEAPNSFHVGMTKVYQEKDSTFNANTIAFGGGITRNNLHITLDAENCTANLYGLYLLSGKSHVDNHTVVDHKQPNSYSNELYKGILDGHSKGVFNGKIFVQQEAQKTIAFQSNKNILLSDNATINTKPQLEIWADDVKCSHGCTTGHLDKDALFYLQARGIDREKAKAMLLYAFAVDVLDNVKIEALKTHLDSIIAERFN